MPDLIWFMFVFAFGCCIGSFLNVVVYRLPRDKSLVSPPSTCPACDKRIQFYDNIPLFSWLLLGRKCRYCKAPISPRYFIIELLTGVVFLGVFILYYNTDIRPGLGSLSDGRWLIYLVHIAMLGGFVAASAIDLELWVIPLSICWFVTGVGLVGSFVGPFIIDASTIREQRLLPWSGAGTASLAFGAVIGLGISLILLATGLLKRSYESQEPENAGDPAQKDGEIKGKPPGEQGESSEPDFNHRLESCREILFLLPIIACAIVTYEIVSGVASAEAWNNFPQEHPSIAGLMGSLYGYFIGCGIVWAIRILGTFGFGKEAMGLGDVHLMGGAGAVMGPAAVVIAFFIAPFFGLAWAGGQMFFKKIRQIPYGPFLSLGVLVVMIFHDWIMSRLDSMFWP